MRFPRLPRFVRRLRLPSIHLPARWQRRLQQFRARLVAAVVYPISLVGYLFVEIGHLAVCHCILDTAMGWGTDPAFDRIGRATHAVGRA